MTIKNMTVYTIAEHGDNYGNLYSFIAVLENGNVVPYAAPTENGLTWKEERELLGEYHNFMNRHAELHEKQVKVFGYAEHETGILCDKWNYDKEW